MQSAVPCIAAFCRADSAIKAIDATNREKRTELFDCNKTVKALIKESMIQNNLTCIELQDGRYIRLKESTSIRSFTPEDILEVCSNLNPNIKSLDLVGLVTETVTERLKEKQCRQTRNQTIVICNNKDRANGTVVADQVRGETKKLISDVIDSHTKLTEFRKQTNSLKKEYVEEKKRVMPDVVQMLKRTEQMHQQVQMVDPKNGLKQTMMLKGTKKEVLKPLNLKNVTAMVKEAAEWASTNSEVNASIFQNIFMTKIKEILENRPKVENTRVALNKRNTIVKM